MPPGPLETRAAPSRRSRRSPPRPPMMRLQKTSRKPATSAPTISEHRRRGPSGGTTAVREGRDEADGDADRRTRRARRDDRDEPRPCRYPRAGQSRSPRSHPTAWQQAGGSAAVRPTTMHGATESAAAAEHRGNASRRPWSPVAVAESQPATRASGGHVSDGDRVVDPEEDDPAGAEVELPRARRRR